MANSTKKHYVGCRLPLADKRKLLKLAVLKNKSVAFILSSIVENLLEEYKEDLR